MLQPTFNWYYNHDGNPRDFVKADYPIFSLSFTDFPAYNSGDFGCMVPSFDTNSLAIYLSTNAVPNALISSVFFQFGPANTNEFNFVIYPFLWNSGIWSQTANSQLIINSAVIGRKNFIYDFTTEANLLQFNGEPIPLGRADFLFSQSTGSQICSVQWFGWYFCQVVAFKPASDTIRMGVGQTKSILIGNLTAYYDPDTHKQNNPFCAMGFMSTGPSWSYIDLLHINNASAYGWLYPISNFTIDSETLAVTLTDFQAPAGVAGDSIQLKVEFPPDTRADLDITPPLTSFQALIPIINLVNFCDLSILEQGIVTLSDGSPIPSNFGYFIGSGIDNFQFQATANCEGFIGALITLTSDGQSIVLSSASEFFLCQIEVPTPLYCLYLDQATGTLKIVSSSKELTTDRTFCFDLTAEYKGYDSSDNLFSCNSVPQSFTITLRMDQNCQTTTLYQQSSENFPLTISTNIFQHNTYSQQIEVLDSHSQTLQINKRCGERTVSLSAEVGQSNFALANSLISCSQTSQFCVSVEEMTKVLLNMAISESQFAGQSLVFELVIKLKFYEAQPLTYQITVNVENVQNQIQTSTSVAFSTTRQNIFYIYHIGITNSPLALRQYFDVQGGYHIASIEMNQIEGHLSSDRYYVDGQSLQLYVDTNDLSLNSATSVFQVCAFLFTQQFNCDLHLTVKFQAASSALIYQRNTAPKFLDTPGTPDPIPCFSTNDALLWSYSFPKAFDNENGSIEFSLDCGAIDSQIFMQKMRENVFTLNLDTTMDDLQAESFECTVKLSDGFAASTIYVVEFKIVCHHFDQTSKFLSPLPTIRNISSSGEVLIWWNVQMRVPSANHRLLKDISDQNDCLNVQIVPGNGSIFSSQRNMSFSYNVSDFKPTSTTLQLVFATPSAISTEKIADQLVIVFTNSSCFTSIQGVRLNKTTSLRRKIPRQKTGGIMQMPESVKTLVRVATVASVFVLVINFFLQGVLNKILSSIISLSVIFHMFLVTLNYPLEMMDFFALLFPLITFDAIPLAKIYERMFHFSTITTDYALTDQFDNSGYSSLFLVNNIGSIFFIAMIQLAISVLLWFVRKVRLFSRLKCVQNKLDTVASNTLWNGLIQFYSGNYLLFCVVSFIQSNDFRFGQNYTSTENFCSILAALGLALAFCFPLFILVLYLMKLQWIDPKLDTDCKIKVLIEKEMSPEERLRQYTQLSQDHSLLLAQLLQSDKYMEFMSTYGCLIKGLRLQRLGRVITVMTPLIDLLLKLLVAVSVTRLVTWPVFSIFVFNFAILFSTEFVLYFNPYESRIEQIRASFNAVSYLVLNYHLFLFTEYNSTAMFPFVANSVIQLVWVCIGVNLLLTFPPMLLQAIKSTKRYYFIKKRKLAIKKAQAASQQLSKLKEQQVKQAEVQFQLEILQDIENRNWEMALTAGQCEIKRLEMLESISEESLSDQSQTQSEQSQTDVEVQDSREQLLISGRRTELSVEEEKQELEQASKNSQVIQKEFNQLRIEENFSSNLQQPNDKQESLQSQEKVLRQSQPTQKKSASKLVAVKTKQQVFQVSKRVQNLPKNSTKAQLTKITHNLMDEVLLPGPAQHIDTRDMTVEAAIKVLIQQRQPIKWHNITFNSERDQLQPDRNKLQRPSVHAFKTVVYERALASDDLIEVREFWPHQPHRCFSILVNNQMYDSIQVPAYRPYDQELKQKIEAIVMLYQIGLQTQLDFNLASSGKVDLKLEQYAAKYPQNKSSNQKMDELYHNYPDFGKYSLSLPLKQKLKMYISIVLHEEQQKKRGDQKELSTKIQYSQSE